MSDDVAVRIEGAQGAAGGVRFRLDFYEGPLDLLLHLVKRNELSPQDVAAKVITEQYLAYLELLDALNLDVAGEYLVMAATLLLIKSYSLLPHAEGADDDESEELKRDLIERLLEYQRYREAADKLAARSILGRDVFTTPGEPVADGISSGPLKVSVFDLIEAMSGVLRRLKEKAPRDLVLRDIPVAECLPRILAAVEAGGRVEFLRLFDDMTDRSLVVATFLGLLELLKRGAIVAYQEVRFGPIFLERGTTHFATTGDAPSGTG
ncbi:MAG: segregation and condensation protein A [Candidatus Binataceae bacterium]